MDSTRHSFGVAARLTLGFLAILVLLVAIAAYATTQISKLGGTFDTFNEKTGSALAASDLLTSLTALQMNIAQLTALNTLANKETVVSAFKQFRESLDRQTEAAGNQTLESTVSEMQAIVSGPESLAAIQDQLDAARGEMAVSNTMMSTTVSAMLHNIDQFTDVAAIATVQERVLKARMLIRSYQFTGSADEIGEALAALRDAERKFDQFDRMGPTVASNPLVVEGRKNLEVMFVGLGKIREAVQRREKTTARTREIGGEIAAQIAAIRGDTLTTMTDAGAMAHDTVSNAFRNSLAAAGFAVVLGLFLAYIIARGISKPIKKMTVSMRQLSKGDLTVQIPGVGRADEIGEMAGAMEVFKESAIERQRLASETEMNRHAEEQAKRKIELEASEQAIAGEREFVVAKFGSGLQRLANGDLTIRLQEEMPGQYERLRHDFNEAIETLSQTLQSVAGAAASIDGRSRKVNSSADDLSRRTEQQAASLEETAAALDQITANVTNSSKRADEARKVALQANASAAESGKVVANAVDAMQKIEQSSNQISNIIGVIDEIAFQTNLLALNAGVEAARAGEAGKGFAVVAQEVRELAQRSANAAKEIKGLIRNSSAEVQSGVRLVSDTGDALRTIEGYIVDVNQHMDAIATSSKEQSLGLAEVNTAVNQMDEVTQQNAAMVEETNAAGASLVDEAASLHELISRFKFDRIPAPHVSHNRHVPQAAASHHTPAASPARRMIAKVANSVNGRAAAQPTWEDF